MSSEPRTFEPATFGISPPARSGGVRRFWGSYTRGLRNFATFKGRTSRADFWQFVLVDFLLTLVPIVLTIHADGTGAYKPGVERTFEVVGGLWFLGYSFVMIIPRLAIGSRRLHDTGRSSAWLLLLPIPTFITWTVFVVFVAGESNDLNNRYGLTSLQPSPPVTNLPPPTMHNALTAPTVEDAGATIEESLRRLKALHDDGILTEDEYQTKRKALTDQL